MNEVQIRLVPHLRTLFWLTLLGAFLLGFAVGFATGPFMLVMQ